MEVKAPSTASRRQPKEQIKVDQLQWLQIDRNILEGVGYWTLVEYLEIQP